MVLYAWEGRCQQAKRTTRDMEKLMNAKIPLRDEERTRCEVWTRVMGYHRPISQFNPGKQSEHRERLHFREDRFAAHFPTTGGTAPLGKVSGVPRQTGERSAGAAAKKPILVRIGPRPNLSAQRLS
jgi:hypothetical protein